MFKLMKKCVADYNNLLVKPQMSFIKKHPLFMGVVMIGAGVYGYWIGTKIHESDSFNFDVEFPDVTEEAAEDIASTLKKHADACSNQVSADDLFNGTWKNNVEGA